MINLQDNYQVEKGAVKMEKAKESSMRRIKKLLALAGNNPNEQEAKAAMLKAQQLMAEQGLSMTDVDGGATLNKVIDNRTQMEVTKWWTGQLAVVLGENFRCYVYLETGTRKQRIVFLGKEEDTTIALSVYEYAKKAIEYQSKKYLEKHKKEAAMKVGLDVDKLKKMTTEELEDFVVTKFTASNKRTFGKNKIKELQLKFPEPRTYRMQLTMYVKELFNLKVNNTTVKNAYINGFIKGLRAAFEEQKEKNQEWGLVLQKDSEVVEAFESMTFNKKSTTSAKVSTNAEAAQEGFKNGKQFQSPKGEIEG
jgi:ribosomal protein L22